MTSRSDAVLSTRLVALADRTKSDLIIMLTKGGKKLSDVEIAQLQVIVGMGIREAALKARSFERWQMRPPEDKPKPKRQPSVIVSPEATSKDTFDDRTTLPMRRHPDHGDE